MDTTEQYIKMSEQATEIQEQWKPQVGDYWVKMGPAEEEIGEVMLIGDEFDRDNIDFKVHKAIWLPTQSQLQDIWYKYYRENSGHESVFTGFIYQLNIWIEDELNYLMKFDMTSGEKVTLAFVMVMSITECGTVRIG